LRENEAPEMLHDEPIKLTGAIMSFILYARPLQGEWKNLQKMAKRVVAGGPLMAFVTLDYIKMFSKYYFYTLF
jgi:hypothetical protein